MVPYAALRGRPVSKTVAAGRPQQTADGDARYRVTAIAVAFAGSFMVMLDTTILGVALPRVGKELGALDDIEWAVTAYLLAVAVVQPATGWLADRFGASGSSPEASCYSRSAPCSLQPLPVSAGSSLSEPCRARRCVRDADGFAIVYDIYPPHRRGAALGLLGVAGMTAPAFGPLIGGWIATSVAWQWLFLVNVPVGIVGVVASARLLRDTGYRDRRPLDWPGWTLAGLGLTAMLLGLDGVGRWGWASTQVALAIGFAFIMLAGFVWRQLHIEHPLISLEMFGVPLFRLTIVLMWFVTFAFFARVIFLSLELQTIRGLTPLETGLIMSPSAVGSGLMMLLGGRLADRVSVRVPILVGLSLMATSTLLMGSLDGDTSLGFIILLTFAQGAGMGLSVMPNAVAALNSLANRFVSQATAVRSLNRSVTGAFGVAFMASVVSTRIGGLSNVSDVAAAQSAYNTVFLVAAAGLGAALLLATRMPGRAGTKALHEARREEMLITVPE